jgi:ABC-2 type transport system permease protein
VRRDWHIARSYRLPYVLEISTIVLTLVLFFYIGKLVDDTTLASTADLEVGYFPFAAIGFALLRILHTSVTSFANKLREEQTTGTLEALMAAPAPPRLVALGSGGYDLIRATLYALLMLLLAVVLFDVRFISGAGSIVVGVGGLVGCLGFIVAVGVAVGAFTVVFKETTALVGLVTTGMGLLAGVYFPLEILPGALQAIGEAIPFTWGLDVVRGALLAGDTDLDRLGLLLAFDALALPGALLLFTGAVHRARRTGTLAHY